MNRTKPVEIEELEEMPQHVAAIFKFISHAFENALINFYNKITPKK